MQLSRLAAFSTLLIAPTLAFARGGPPAKAPFSKRERPSPERQCTKDHDCVFRPRHPCRCARCGDTWRRSVNRLTLTRLHVRYKGPRCQRKRCPQCSSPLRWLGNQPVCIQGQCAVRETRPAFQTRNEKLVCKKNVDCVVAYDPCRYRVAPCEDTFKPVLNRTADRARRARWSKKKAACRTRTCAPSKYPRPRWVGRRAICDDGQCRIER